MALVPASGRLEATPPAAEPARRRWSLRRHLLVLVLAVLLPALVAGGVSAWHLANSYRHAFEARLQDTARALALFIDSELESSLTAVAALASSPLLDRDDLEDFAAWAHAIGQRQGGWVVVNEAAPGHRQLLNTTLPAGAPLPPPSPPGEGAWSLIRRAIETGQPAVSDLFTGRGTGRSLVAVAAPARQGDEITRVVVLTLDPLALSERLRSLGPSGSAFASVADGQGRIVARSRDHERFFGTIPPSRQVPAEQRARGVFRSQSVYGEPALYAAQPIPAAQGWSVVVAEPESRYRASWIWPLAAYAGIAAVAVGLAAAIATLLARRILRPVHGLLARADAVVASGPGPLLAPPATAPSGVTEFERLREASERAETALARRESDFRAIFETAAVGVVEVDAVTGHYLRVNRRFCEIAGRDRAELLGRLGPDDLCVPEDQGRSAVSLAIAQDREVEAEFRLLHADGTEAWVRASASISARDAEGRPLRVVSVVRDITRRKRSEEARSLLAREVDHRAKNVLAVVQAALRLTPRDNLATYIQSIQGRVAALARAHTMLAEAQWSGADLRSLAEAELRAFLPMTSGDAGAPRGAVPRAVLAGPFVMLSPGAAQALSMVLHELATNAIKHGALSAAGGSVDLAWLAGGPDGMLRLDWTERGGPRIEQPPSVQGFGSRLIAATLKGQLGGTVQMLWQPDGLACHIAIPMARVTSREGG
ncbi:PAS domain S-box protein [Falsiroseomonas sp. E2-1-a20]|uniref:PAS domain S-box protein n=1 Tax=Falsiroseomonas sp. E2-1-a20 TaxID=3239300 RepID=UPI003F353AC1